MLNKLSTLLLSTIITTTSFAGIVDQWNQDVYEGKSVLCKRDANGTESTNSGELVRPGSTSKLYTTLWALETLGLDHQFETKFYIDNETLIIHGLDPYFTLKDLNKFLEFVDGKYSFNKVIASESFKLNGSKLAKALSISDVKISNELPSKATLITSSSDSLIGILKAGNQLSRNSIFENLFSLLGGSKAFSRYMEERFEKSAKEVYFHTGSGLGENYSTCSITLEVMESIDNLLLNENLIRANILKIENSLAINSGRVNNQIMSAYFLSTDDGPVYVAMSNTAFKKDYNSISNNHSKLIADNFESFPESDKDGTGFYIRDFFESTFEKQIEKSEEEEEDSFIDSIINGASSFVDTVTAPYISASEYFETRISELEDYDQNLNEYYKNGELNSYTNYADIRNSFTKLNSLDQIEMIAEFNKLYKDKSFAVIDKESETLTTYSSNGEKLRSFTINFPNGKGDKRARVNSPYQKAGHDNNFGAGKYTLIESNNEYLMTLNGDPALLLKDERGRTEISISVPSTTGNLPYSFEDYNNGNLNVTYMDFAELSNILEDGSEVYVLPKKKSSYFKASNSTISFVTNDTTDYYEYNFSTKSKTYREIKTVIDNDEYSTTIAKIFIHTLDKEKENLMKLYRLGNDEYNELMKISFGILGNESRFGTSVKLYLKETAPAAVAFAKNVKRKHYKDMFSTSRNSRGYTQIKRIPKKIREFYKFNKEDLIDPANCAVATLGFLANSLLELKAKEKFHNNITPENRFNYLIYIYTGRSSQIKKGTATPEKNIYYRNMRKYSSALRIFQKM
jgi:hypothetical protein